MRWRGRLRHLCTWTCINTNNTNAHVHACTPHGIQYFGQYCGFIFQPSFTTSTYDMTFVKVLLIHPMKEPALEEGENAVQQWLEDSKFSKPARHTCHNCYYSWYRNFWVDSDSDRYWGQASMNLISPNLHRLRLFFTQLKRVTIKNCYKVQTNSSFLLSLSHSTSYLFPVYTLRKTENIEKICFHLFQVLLLNHNTFLQI